MDTFGYERSKMEERIKAMYNDAWKIYKEYLSSRDIAAFTDNGAALCEKYGHETDVCNLMFWWSARVQGLNDEYLRGLKYGRN